ncbi:hypothetical protein RHMOL_Rhmol10G0050000 [Rhododendron molle]|uniref:Uncharacterized protein n=1 Tax=Rhododendron molle TaxID=49168 RepID=A0ACC0M013_RHOML|nr:hypothetical protein RHMOL_Rhmol10G0050000 [Rhododendron molle]
MSRCDEKESFESMTEVAPRIVLKTSLEPIQQDILKTSYKAMLEDIFIVLREGVSHKVLKVSTNPKTSSEKIQISVDGSIPADQLKEFIMGAIAEKDARKSQNFLTMNLCAQRQ